MKPLIPFLFQIFGFSAFQLFGQITVPIVSTVTIPTNAVTVVNLTYVTNFIVTNLYVTNFFVTFVSPTSPISDLPGNIVDPALSRRLVKRVTGPIALQLAPFADDVWSTVYLQNPGKWPVTWPVTNLAGAPIHYHPAPPGTNDDFPVVLFESILGIVIASQ